MMPELPRLGTRFHDRRAVLRMGALGFGSFTLEHFLRLRQAQAEPREPSKTEAQSSTGSNPESGERAGSRGTAKSAILFWLAGGPSHLDMYDMKPGATAEVRGPFHPIQTRLPGLLVNEYMPRHVDVADQLAVIRSISHSHAVHDDGSHWMQTGYPLLNARQEGQRHPCEGSLISYFRGPQRPDMPAYVCVPEDYQTHLGFYQTGAFLGKRFDALNAANDPNNRKYGGPGFTLPPDISSRRLLDRRGLLQSFDRFRSRVGSSDQLRDADEVQQQAFDLIGSRHAREAFDLAREPDSIQDLYGRHSWGQAALLARRLVEAGVRFVTINLYEKDVDWWDDHYTIEPNLIKRLPRYDQAFCGLLADLRQRGLADEVLVAAYGEFGRSPRIDNNAGRGHWPKAMSVVLSGGGIRTGQIVGSTTADGGEPDHLPLVPGDLLATIYQVLGIDPTATVTDRLGRPIPLVPQGQPIRQLVG